MDVNYRRILEHLNTTVLTVDRDLRLTSINSAGEVLFAASAQQLRGQAMAELLPQNWLLVDEMTRAVTSNQPFTEHGLRIVLSGGREFLVDCVVTPLMEQNTTSELLVEWAPVDRLLRLTREETMHDQHAASRALIRGLAHEIKNPLGGLRGAAQLLERELHTAALKEYTRIIIHEADRLRNLVDRMIGPTKPMQRLPVNIHQVFEHVRSLILAEIPEGIRILRDYDTSLPELTGDSEQLIQAVLNMARNAVQAMNNRGTIRFRSRIERQFTIGQVRHRLVLRAEIEDDGPGIPEELKETLFYPLVTSRAGGSGLGLSIARDIVLQHGGQIECESRPKQTIFRLYLPYGEHT